MEREKRVSSPHINTESKRENLEGVFFSLSLSLLIIIIIQEKKKREIKRREEVYYCYG